jgi:hypothetical protein
MTTDTQINLLATNLKTIVDTVGIKDIQKSIERYLDIFDEETSKKIYNEYCSIFNKTLPLSFLITTGKSENYNKCLISLSSLNISDIKREWPTWSNAILDSIKKDFDCFDIDPMSEMGYPKSKSRSKSKKEN